MKHIRRSRSCLFLLILTSSLFLNRCGTREGNGLVTIDFQGYSQSAWFFLVKPAYASVSSVTFCFKRLRFKPEGKGTSSNPEQDPDNVDFSIGEKTISPTGTSLGSISLPAGTYKRIEFDLENKCSSGKSIQVSNSSGNFNTNERITIKFEGTFTMSQADKRLSLSTQSIINVLDGVTSNSEIRTKAESASGSFND